MNDIRNLMHKLGGDLDYKEFGAAAAAEAALATQLRAAAFARSGRGGGGQGFSLGQYVAGPVAAASNPEADRKLPLAEVFARLSQARTRVVG